MVFSTLFFACALSPFFLVKNCSDSFSATIVNHQCGMVRVIRHLVDVHVVHRNDWLVFVRSSAYMMLVCGVSFLGLARRSRTSSCKASESRSVCCILLGLLDLQLGVSQHVPLFFDAFFQTNQLLLMPPCPIGAIIVDGLTSFPFVT